MANYVHAAAVQNSRQQYSDTGIVVYHEYTQEMGNGAQDTKEARKIHQHVSYNLFFDWLEISFSKSIRLIETPFQSYLHRSMIALFLA